jgi:hypothetical protein
MHIHKNLSGFKKLNIEATAATAVKLSSSSNIHPMIRELHAKKSMIFVPQAGDF